MFIGEGASHVWVGVTLFVDALIVSSCWTEGCSDWLATLYPLQYFLSTLLLLSSTFTTICSRQITHFSLCC